MAIIGTDEEDKMPTSSSSPNAVAAAESANGVPYSGAGGFAGGTGTGSGQGATPGTAAPARAPESYANLSQYLSANQTTGGITGRAAENVVQQSGNQALAAQNDYNTSGLSDIAGATKAAGADSGTLNKIKAGIPGLDPKMIEKINAGGNVETGEYKAPSDFKDVKYKGPDYNSVKESWLGPNDTSFQGYEGTQGKQADAIMKQGIVKGNVNNAKGGQSGVSALLHEAYQQPQYTVGENTLDAFLAGGTAEGQKALGRAEGVGKGVDSSYDKINAALQGKIGAGQKTLGATNKAYQDAIKAAGDKAAATKKGYEDAAKKAAEKTKSDYEKAAEEKKKKQELVANSRQYDNVSEPPEQLDVLGTRARKGSQDVLGTYVRAVENVPRYIEGGFKDPASIPGNVSNAAKKALEDYQAGLKNIGDQAGTFVENVGNVDLKRPLGSPKFSAPKVSFSQGGEIPDMPKADYSYSNLVRKLGGGK